MNNKIIELLSRATPANDTSAPASTAHPAHPQIKLSLFNRNNIARDGSNITIISLDSALVIAIILALIILGVFFQQKI